MIFSALMSLAIQSKLLVFFFVFLFCLKQKRMNITIKCSILEFPDFAFRHRFCVFLCSKILLLLYKCSYWNKVVMKKKLHENTGIVMPLLLKVVETCLSGKLPSIIVTFDFVFFVTCISHQKKLLMQSAIIWKINSEVTKSFT